MLSTFINVAKIVEQCCGNFGTYVGIDDNKIDYLQVLISKAFKTKFQ